MSQADVSYSCGACGYPLNLTSSNRVTSGIGSEYHKPIKKGYISFLTIDLSRFTQVDKKVHDKDPCFTTFRRPLTNLEWGAVLESLLLPLCIFLMSACFLFFNGSTIVLIATLLG
ncbi:uncharacterized protein LOC127797396 isoform X3 [Diospyros lotus]|uniref:uncharacterized protein LOC127797396 isoform X3 n=1 Tax=Diospyros lotus TaxID=55363 RepID=UPI0022583CA3|nr:uncharacterized protein LOC127797396 isoform X3 [Diospyros lotus]